MVLNCFDVYQFLDGILQDVVSVDLEKEPLAIYYLTNLRVPEWAHEEEVSIGLPLYFVVSLDHASFDVWSHQPVVATRIEVVFIMCYRSAFTDLSFCLDCPLVHQLAKVKIVVHSIIVEFFLVNLLAWVLERKV